MDQSFPEKCGRVQAGLLAVLSMFIIWLPALDSFVHLDKAPVPNENRALAGFPELQSGLKNLRKYIAGLESYFNDHFGFRKRLVRWQHLWKHDLFKDSLTSEDVIFGRDGWLYLAGEDMLGSEARPFTFFELKEWKILLESRRDWCAGHGCAYIFVIPPDKHSIYREHLPNWLLPLKEPSKLDQFIAYMKTNSTVPILDLRPSLLAAKTNGILYLVTDTHWNNFGAFTGYQSLIIALARQLPGLKPLPLDAFEWKTVPQQGGDLSRLLGQEQSTIERANVVFSPLPPLKPLAVTIDTNLLVKNWVKLTEPTFTINPETKGKVIIFHDSFACDWQPLLGYHFNKVIYIWQNNWDMDFLEQQKPDVVIDEMLERIMIIKDPDNLTENN
jgi:alginate O-acetyltransferase complex protein AlgJ